MSQEKTPAKKLKYECRFAVYCPPPEPGIPDLHVVKEIVHELDGSTRSNLRFLYDHKRPYWITNKGCQNHKDKKEWEYLNRVTRFESTQTNLFNSVANAIGTPWFRGDMRKLNASPYIYGTDILSTALIKRKYQDQFPGLNTPYSSASLDTETDVLHGTNRIVMATLSMKERVFTAVTKKFLQGHASAGSRLHHLFEKYLSAMEGEDKAGNPTVTNFIEARGLKWELMIVDTDLDVVRETFKRAHAWQPDFLEVWNIDFDIPKILETLEHHGVSPAEIFSDPRVPRQYKFFKYKRGPSQKTTSAGLVTPIKPPQRWHTVFAPASFYMIDGMCAYRHIRNGAGEEPSYSLDALLGKHLGMRKLKIDAGKDLVKIDWHIFMQEHHPLEYVIYNVFDCVSMEVLDEKINDLSLTLPLFSGCSDFESFKSQPKRTADNLHFFVQEQAEPRVMGSTSNDMMTPLDKLTVGVDDWIFR